MNEENIKLRVGPIEFCWSPTNLSYELLRWFSHEKGEHCCVIAFFHRTKEGYDMRTVGRRYEKASREDQGAVMIVVGYAFDILQARFKAEEASNELMREASWKQ